uniref:Uncharacterized protein n=1 Tax=Triticum urartu TaxID=4572 RepID=A0A8R7QRJ2_TRIUA
MRPTSTAFRVLGTCHFLISSSANPNLTPFLSYALSLFPTKEQARLIKGARSGSDYQCGR